MSVCFLWVCFSESVLMLACLSACTICRVISDAPGFVCRGTREFIWSQQIRRRRLSAVTRPQQLLTAKLTTRDISSHHWTQLGFTEVLWVLSLSGPFQPLSETAVGVWFQQKWSLILIITSLKTYHDECYWSKEKRTLMNTAVLVTFMLS